MSEAGARRLHDWHGALAYERDGYSVGADAVAGDSATGVGSSQEGMAGQ